MTSNQKELRMTQLQFRTDCKRFIRLFVRNGINFVCCAFVIFQSYKCFAKYYENPKGTHVSLVSPKLYPYPEITFCPVRDEYYAENLANCNLTVTQYFFESRWFSPLCPDPKILYEVLVNKTWAKVVPELQIYGFDATEVIDDFFQTEEDMLNKESPFNGRCLSLKLPVDREIWKLKIRMDNFESMYVFVATPDDFLGAYNYHRIEVVPDVSKTVNLFHEVAKVFDFDGQECQRRCIRDDCIVEYIEKVSFSTHLFCKINLIFLIEFDGKFWMYHTIC